MKAKSKKDMSDNMILFDLGKKISIMVFSEVKLEL